MSQYVVRQDGEKHGPYMPDELREQFKAGKFTRDAEIRREFENRWRLASEIPSLRQYLPPPPPDNQEPPIDVFLKNAAKATVEQTKKATSAIANGVSTFVAARRIKEEPDVEIDTTPPVKPPTPPPVVPPVGSGQQAQIVTLPSGENVAVLVVNGPAVMMPSQTQPNVRGPEKVLLEARPAMFRNNPIGFLVAVALIPVFGLGVLILIVWSIQCWFTKLTITTDRTEFRKGFIAKSTSELRHRDIRSIVCRQGVLQRIFGVGSVGVESAAEADLPVILHGAVDPQSIATLLRSLQRSASP